MLESQRYDELHVKIAPANQAAFVEAVDRHLPTGWRRMDSSELRFIPKSEFYYYSCTAEAQRPAALLAMYRADEETLYVSNVVPLEPNHTLKSQEYNAVLREFEQLITSTTVPFPVAIHWKQHDSK